MRASSTNAASVVAFSARMAISDMAFCTCWAVSPAFIASSIAVAYCWADETSASALMPPEKSSQLSPEAIRSEEHTSELQSLMRISYAVFCLKKKNTQHPDRTADKDILRQQHTKQ